MKKIKTLVKQIREELHDAEGYAKLSAQYKDDDQQLSSLYRQLSNQELDHVNMEHEQVLKYIREQQQNGVEIPKEMQAVWDWEHQNMIEDVTTIKLILST